MAKEKRAEKRFMLHSPNAPINSKTCWGIRARGAFDFLRELDFITDAEASRIVARMKRWDKEFGTVYFHNR